MHLVSHVLAEEPNELRNSLWKGVGDVCNAFCEPVVSCCCSVAHRLSYLQMTLCSTTVVYYNYCKWLHGYAVSVLAVSCGCALAFVEVCTCGRTRRAESGGGYGRIFSLYGNTVYFTFFQNDSGLN